MAYILTAPVIDKFREGGSTPPVSAKFKERRMARKKKLTDVDKMIERMDGIINDNSIIFDERAKEIATIVESSSASGIIGKYALTTEFNESLEKFDFHGMTVAWLDENGDIKIWTRQVELDDARMYVPPVNAIDGSLLDTDPDGEYMTEEEEKEEEESILDDDEPFPCPKCNVPHTFREYLKGKCCPDCGTKMN